MDAFATEAERAWRAGEQYVFAVVLDDAPIGACDVRRVSSRLPIGEIGYWVGSAHSSKGYMSEAACAVRDFGFDALRLDRIQLRAGVGNAASRRIAAKLGFRQEGLLRHGTGGGDGPYDCYLYGMLASDPRPSI